MKYQNYETLKTNSRFLKNIISCFCSKTAQGYIKKLMYFTYNDNPHEDNPALQNDAYQKFKDLGSVDLNILSFNSDFNFQSFYQVSPHSITYVVVVVVSFLNSIFHVFAIAHRTYGVMKAVLHTLKIWNR